MAEEKYFCGLSRGSRGGLRSFTAKGLDGVEVGGAAGRQCDGYERGDDEQRE